MESTRKVRLYIAQTGVQERREGDRMRRPENSIVVLTATVLLWSMCLRAASCNPGGPDTTLLSRTCNGKKVRESPHYATAISYCLMALFDRPIKGFDYYTTGEFRGAVVFGRGACNGALSQLSCNDCLNIALDALGPCALSIGASRLQAPVRDLSLHRMRLGSTAPCRCHWRMDKKASYQTEERKHPGSIMSACKLLLPVSRWPNHPDFSVESSGWSKFIFIHKLSLDLHEWIDDVQFYL